MIQTHYKKEERVGEVFTTDTQTEQVGFMTVKQQLERMMRAGVNLGNYRKELYHFGSDQEVPDDFSDPLTTPNYDLADASREYNEAVKRISAGKANRVVEPESTGSESGEGAPQSEEEA